MTCDRCGSLLDVEVTHTLEILCVTCRDRDARPLARLSDPEPSQEAAADVAPRLGDLQSWALSVVSEHPGKTCSELADIERLRDVRKIGRRLGELEQRNLVTRAGPRKCEVTGKSAAIWYAHTQEDR